MARRSAFIPAFIAASAMTQALADPPRFNSFFDPDRLAREEIISELDCGTPPPGPASLELRSRTDLGEGETPAEGRERYKKAVAFINDYGNTVSKLADRAILALIGGDKAGRCAVDWLHAWASVGAMTGAMSKSGVHIRKWELAGYSASYSKVRQWASPEQRSTIEAWLRQLGTEVINDFPAASDLPSRHNNHLYWVIWGVANAAVATEDERLWAWARQRYSDVLAGIPADGFLPLELERGKSALGYHIYATAALVLTAELFERNGVPAYSLGDGALHRLVRRSLQGLRDPSPFAERAGEPQELKPVRTGSRLSWLEAYHARFPSPEAEALLDDLRPLGHRTYGGNLTALFAAQ